MHCRTTIRKRQQLIERDGGTHCYYCGVAFDQTIKKRVPTIDHLIPEAQGGHRTDLSNLVLACFRCNTKKGAMTAEAFLASPYLMQRRHQLTKQRRRRAFEEALSTSGTGLFMLTYGATKRPDR